MAPRLTPKQRKAVEDMIGEVYDQLAALPGPILVKLRPILDQAERETVKELGALLAKQDGGAAWSAQMERVALAKIRRARALFDKAGGALAGGLKEGLTKRTGPLSLTNLEKEVGLLTGMFEGSATGASFDTAAVLLRAKGPLFRQFEASAKRYAGEAGDRLAAEIAVSRVRGETVAQTRRRLDRTIPAVFDGFRSRADMVARTETMNAYNAVHEEGIRDWAATETGVMLLWDASQDYRVCVICGSLHGQTVAVDAPGKSGLFTSVVGSRGRTHERPPAHPNCRCVLLPWKDDWAQPPQVDQRELRKLMRQAVPEPVPSRHEAPRPAGAPQPVAKPQEIGRAEHGAMADGFAAAKTPNSVRDPVVRHLRDRYGLVYQDPASASTKWQKPSLMPGANGLHYHLGGDIELRENLKRDVVGFHRDMSRGEQPTAEETNAAQVFVHEVLHGFSAKLAGASQGVGMYVEEVATEVAARRVMLDMGVSSPRIRLPSRSRTGEDWRPYDNIIHHTIDAVRAVNVEDWATASARVERASFEAKKGGAKARNSEEHLGNFAQHLGLSPERQEAFKDKMRRFRGNP